MDQFYRFQIGDFTCFTIWDNSRTMPTQQLFSPVNSTEVAQVMAEAEGSLDEVTVGYNCLLVDTGERRVLVDTGSGQGKLVEHLRLAGFDAAAIDTVIITHGDGDHIGGIEDFPAARLIMTTEAWSLWTQPDKRATMIEEFIALFRDSVPEDQLQQRAQSRARYGEEVLPALQERIDLVEPEVDFMPGFKLLHAPGHRSDHTAVEVQSGDETLLHIVDGIRHPIQVSRPDWVSFIDSYPAQTVKSNQMLFRRAAQTEAVVFGGHLTFPAIGRVQTTDSGWVWASIS